VLKSEGSRLIRKPRHRWVDNVKMDLGETKWGRMGWKDLDRD
jgi:hypothetical protein